MVKPTQQLRHGYSIADWLAPKMSQQLMNTNGIWTPRSRRAQGVPFIIQMNFTQLKFVHSALHVIAQRLTI